MKRTIKENWKYILLFTIIGAIGGYFIGIFLPDSYPAEVRQQALEQGITATTLGLVSAVQSAAYGLILGTLGIFLASKIGLWTKDKSITKKPLILSLAVGAFGGAAMILCDILWFGRYSQPIMDSYAAKPSVPYMIAAVTYGAVIEEVMLRLFLMSLIAFILYKLFARKRPNVPVGIFMIANVICAALFAAGHLPVTSMTLGLSPIIVFRCFLLNGGIGLLFGYLYRKYGLRYAIIAHAGCHIVSKLIWIAFL
ncbi:MAG: CPBP family intramembrane metalloprotease [Ruminococcus sp.]|nr:CPBP family intramembrane metalloprotease [Ruminococcus sp.]